MGFNSFVRILNSNFAAGEADGDTFVLIVNDQEWGHNMI